QSMSNESDAVAEPRSEEACKSGTQSSGRDEALQAIADTLESVKSNLASQSARVDVAEESLSELAGAVKQLIEQEQKKSTPRRYRFAVIDMAGQRAVWNELADFVDDLNIIFGTSAYSEHQEWRIPEWWWKQPIVVFELAALKAAWDEAFTATTPDAPTTEMIAWIDRWFWPCMNRIFNDRWGLQVSPAPDKDGTQFSIMDAVNDRDEFNAFLSGKYDAQTEDTDGSGGTAAGAIA